MPRLFEQSENTTPNTAQRIAFGRAAVATENMTLANLLTWLETYLGFLKTANDLSDLNSAPDARTNLGVYSSAQVNVLLNAKTNIYPNTGGALKTNNTSSFTPSANYHPATKKYVDDNTLLPLFTGYTELGDIGSGVDQRTVSLGTTLSTSNYIVVNNLRDLATGASVTIQDIIWGTYDHATTSFKLALKETSGKVQNLRLYFMIYAADSFTLCSNS